ncbi:MAG: AraC family transcriptional regulator [Polyangia bacterium]
MAQPADLVSRVRGLLLAHLAANWGIGELASVLGMSARVLQQRLRAAGTSFSSELIAVRIDVARSLLAEPGSSVKEVAQAVGFLDVASFSRFLRRHTGRPPSSHQG